MKSLLTVTITLVSLTMGCGSQFRDEKGKDNGKKNSVPADTELPSGQKIPGDSPLNPVFSFAEEEFLAQSTASSESLALRVKAANKFHFDLAAKLVKNFASENVTLSGFSVQTAFALLFPSAAAESKTASEMAATLGFSGTLNDFLAAMHAQLLSVQKAFAPVKDPEDARIVYNLVNQVWTDDEFGLQDAYLGQIKRYFNSGVARLPLRSRPEESRQTINRFVAYNTNDLITDLIPEESINDSSVAVLTNSIYMLADWEHQFEKESTTPKPFTNLAGDQVTRDTMHQTGYFQFAEADSYQALSLPYVGGKVAMMIVLPAKGSFSEVEGSFDADAFEALFSKLSGRSVQVSLPKFTVEWGSKSVTEPLKELGLKTAFDPSVNNFPQLLSSGGAPYNGRTHIEEVFHKAKVIVDEKGTEAAAATAIVIGDESASEPGHPVVFSVDRPALFYIYDTEGRTILFGGRIVKL